MCRVCVFVVAVLGSVGIAEAQTTREVTPTERSIVSVSTKLRFTTLIVLPADEEILDFVCGDRDFWVVSGAENLAYVKPAKAGAQTNLHLVTSSGRVYAFLLTEGTGEPDLKVFVRPEEPASGLAAPQRYYAAHQVETARRDAEAARRELEVVKAGVSTAIDEGIHRFRAAYPGQLRFPYAFKVDQPPFHVSAIFHDGRFTYIRTASSELPALYEVRDGAPNLIPFQVEEGVYVVPKVLERGYLAVGNARLPFEAR